MSEKDYSIDEILSEYSGKKSSGSGKKIPDNFDVDEFLNSGSSSEAFRKKDGAEALGQNNDSSSSYDTNVSSEAKKADAFETKLESKTAPDDNNSKAKQNSSVFDTDANQRDVKPFVPLKKSKFKDKKLKASMAENTGSNNYKPVAEPVLTDEQLSLERKNLKPIKPKSGNTAIINSLMKLKSERGTVKNTAVIPPVNRASINDIDLNLNEKIIPKTEIGLDENATEAEKIAYLNAKRREKIKEFVLSTDDEDEQKTQTYTEDDVPDFNDFSEAEKVSSEIAALKGNLVIRLCFLIITCLLSVYMTVANDMGWRLISALSRTENMGTAYLFIHIVLGLLASFVSYTVLTVGVKKLFTLKADSDSLAAVSMITSLASAIIMLSHAELMQTRYIHIYISVAILGLLFNTLGKLLIVSRTERNFRYVSGGYNKYGIFAIHDEDVANRFTKGALSDFPSLSSMRQTEFVRDFIKNSYSADLSDSFCRLYVPVVFGVSIIVGLICAFILPDRIPDSTINRVYLGFGGCAGTMALCSSAAMMLVVNLPLAKAAKKYLQFSAVMLGYSAVDEFADTNSVLIDARQLFPDGMVEIVNLKPMSATTIEEGILVGASLACQADSILKPAFYKMLRGKTEMLYPVESYIYEDTLGLSGWIENKRVLLGTRMLMESHSIDGLPSLEKEAQYARNGNLALYLSIGGTISTVFIIQIKASMSVAKSLKELERNKITVIVRSVDAMVSLSRLSEMFGVAPSMFKLLPFRFHADYDNQTSYTPQMSTPMICSGRFTSFTMLIVGAKRILKACTAGLSIQLLSAVLGVVLAAVLALVGSFSQLTASICILYTVIWAAVTLLIQSFFKS